MSPLRRPALAALPVLLFLGGCSSRAPNATGISQESEVTGSGEPEWRVVETVFVDYDAYDPPNGVFKSRVHVGPELNALIVDREAFARAIVNPEAEGRFQT